jgi:hypothetical protein
MSWVAVGVTAVGAIGSYAAGRQKAPAAATYQPVDVAAESAKAIAANQANFGEASALAAKTNRFNLSQETALLEKAMPGFSALQGKLLAKVNSDLNSDTSLPSDVQSKIAQFAAEKGIHRGTSGNFNGFSLVKDFGFNLVDYQNASRARALSTLSSVFKMAPRVNPMSPMSMFVTPDKAIDVAGKNHGLQYSAEQANYNEQAEAGNANRQLAAGTISNVAGAFAGGIRTRAARTPVAPVPAGVQAKVVSPPTYSLLGQGGPADTPGSSLAQGFYLPTR